MADINDVQKLDDEALLTALGMSLESEQPPAYSAEQQRVMFAFSQINDFIDIHNRIPSPHKDGDIFERLHAIRLQKMQHTTAYVDILKDMDTHGLLSQNPPVTDDTEGVKNPVDTMDDRALLSALGVDMNKAPETDITTLTHIGEKSLIRSAETIGKQVPCPDFATFKPIFEQRQQGLQNGSYVTCEVTGEPAINVGDMFIIQGQKVYVASKQKPEQFKVEEDYRIRVIYDNGTQIDTLIQSFQRALRPETAKNRTRGRRIQEAGDLLSAQMLPTGTVYVLTSKSSLPHIEYHQGVLHKIGVTGGDVKTRLANAKNDPTFLMDEVEVVAEYTLHNIDRIKLENLIHRFFDSARANITIKDRFGKSITPREWFMVPLHIINEAMEKIQNGTINQYMYDVDTANIVKTSLF